MNTNNSKNIDGLEAVSFFTLMTNWRVLLRSVVPHDNGSQFTDFKTLKMLAKISLIHLNSSAVTYYS